MYFGLNNNFHPSQFTSDVSTSAHGQPNIHTQSISQQAYSHGPIFYAQPEGYQWIAPPPYEELRQQYVKHFASLPTVVADFAYRSKETSRLLGEYFAYFSSLHKSRCAEQNIRARNQSLPDLDRDLLVHRYLVETLSNVASDFVPYLKLMTCIAPMELRHANDDILVNLLWNQFRDELSQCIGIIENIPVWMHSGLGAGFLMPELMPQIKEHIDELQKIGASLSAFQPAEQTTRMRRTNPEHTRHPLNASVNASAKARHAHNQRARVLTRVWANAKTQTNDLQAIGTQTSIVPHMDGGTQTDAPINIAADRYISQSTSTRPDVAHQYAQTGSSTTRNAQTETDGCNGLRQKLKHKNVGTNAVKRVDSSVQTYSKDAQVVNQWWMTLEEEVDKAVRQVLAPEGWVEGNEYHVDVDVIAADLAQHFSGAYFLLQAHSEGLEKLFQTECEKSEITFNKNELWSTFVDYFLPCMEKSRVARSALCAELFSSGDSKQSKNREEAIKIIISVLNMSLMLVMRSNEWLPHFKWTQDKGKKSAIDRFHSFSSSDPVLKNFLIFHQSVARLAYLSSSPMDVIEIDENQGDSMDMASVQAALDQIAAIEYVECLAAQQSGLVNDFILKTGSFKNVSKADRENFVLNIWFPAVTTVKLLAQKQWSNNAGEEVDIKLSCRVNTFLRNARWAAGQILPEQFGSLDAMKDTGKKQRIEAFVKVAHPESEGMLKDIILVQDLLKYKIEEIHQIFIKANHDWIVEKIPLALFVRCTDTDTFTTEMLEEWAALVSTIKSELNNLLRSKGSRDEVKNYVNCLNEAKTYYQILIRNGVSAKDEDANRAELNARSRPGVDILDSYFGPKEKNPKAGMILHNLAKCLGCE